MARKRASSDVGTELAALRKQLEALAASIETTAKTEGTEAFASINDRARDFLGRAANLVDELTRDARDNVGERAHQLFDRARGATEDSAERLEDAIRDRPLAAMAVALFAGCALAMLLRRR